MKSRNLGTEDGKNSARKLADICREMDPTRPVSSGIHLSINTRSGAHGYI